MNPDLLNILSNSNKDIDNQLLMDYLNGKLSGEQKHEVERLIAESDFMRDAVEGLEPIAAKRDLTRYVEELNAAMQKNLQKKKLRREKRRFRDNPWTYLAILLIILLCIAAYEILHKILPTIKG
jgi:hypothetical protein